MGATSFLLLLISFVILSAAQCPKETFWKDAKCYGSKARHENIAKNRVVRVSETCCPCPSRKQLESDSRGCFFKTSWFKKRIDVDLSCCRRSPDRQEGRLSASQTLDDPAKAAFNLVEGSGFNSAPRAPSNLAMGTGRRLLHLEWQCAQTNVNVRTCGSPKCQRVRIALPGERIQVAERRNGWLRIGLKQWSYARYWKTCPEEGNEEGVASIAINSPRLVQEVTRGAVASPLTSQVTEPSISVSSRSSATSDRVQALDVQNGFCPIFYKIWQGYPPINKVPSPELVASLGFGSWITNTCAIRTTLSLRNAGYQPGEIGRTKWRANGKRYLIRVKEIDPFLTATFGVPFIVAGPGIATGRKNAEGDEIYDHPKEFQGKAGLMMYTNCNFNDATGHFDVWDGQSIRSQGYPDRCKTMSLFNVCEPIPSPDYTKFIEHLKKTNAQK